jgi:hypothetical protein
VATKCPDHTPSGSISGFATLPKKAREGEAQAPVMKKATRKAARKKVAVKKGAGKKAI